MHTSYPLRRASTLEVGATRMGVLAFGVFINFVNLVTLVPFAINSNWGGFI